MPELKPKQRAADRVRVHPSSSSSAADSTRAVAVALVSSRAPSVPALRPQPAPGRQPVNGARALRWSAVALVHALCALFFACCALLYHKIPSTIVAINMRAFGLSLDPKHFPVLTALHAAGASVHALLLLEMLLYSAFYRTLVFTHEAFLSQQQSIPSHQLRRSLSLRSLRKLSTIALLKRLTRSVQSSYARWFGHDGVFGVDKSYFPSLFLLRELGEIVLQSYQAWRMSRLMPRVWLNRLYVALLVANCWSTPALERLLLHSRRRVVSSRQVLRMCLVVDTVLDFVSTVAIPTLLAIPYLYVYDPQTQDFEEECWNDDTWYMDMVNDFKLLFVQSWTDCAQHCVLSVSLLVCLDDVKILASDQEGDVETGTRSSLRSPRRQQNPTVAAVAPGQPAPIATDFTLTARKERRHTQVSSWGSWTRRVHLGSVAHGTMVLWGIVVACLHLDAQRDNHHVPGCLVHVHPWRSPKTACSLLLIDCLNASSLQLPMPRGGAAHEIESAWESINDQALDLLTIANCPALQIPPSIQSFTHLMGINLLNSTLMEWGADAALTRRHHVNLRHLGLMSVDLTPSLAANTPLPPGLLALDFPPLLRDIFIADCALYDGVPVELPQRWPQHTNLMLLANALDRFPAPLLEMAPIRIVLDYNAITSVPIGVFAIDSLVSLELVENPIRELPELPELPPDSLSSPFSLGASLTHLNVKGTNVSRLPQWMMTQAFLSRVTVRAGGSPLCLDLADDNEKSERSQLLNRYIDCSE